ncbi:alanyl-tRNA editing protein [Spirochaetia bacterium]|nr:alanyl-tRNA editing protein [Spirochaetia bacterium]
MQTERAYYDYSAAGPYMAKILELRSPGQGPAAGKIDAALAAVILDKTIFYPEGGGQGADRGSINGVPLLDVREASTEQGEEILHLVNAADAVTLIPGPAELLLDVKRRRDLTVHHTAQHLLSGTILKFTGKHTVSMHLGEEICTIDVDTAGSSVELSAETIIKVEEAAADAIEEDHPVITHLCPPEDVTIFPLRKKVPQGEEVIRVVEIQGNDFSPCCGTHCKSTGQIGMLRILGAEKYKGMTRVTFIAGRRCLRDSRLLRQNGDLISRSLKVPVNESGRAVQALLDKTAGLERDLKAFEEAAAETKAEALLRKINAETVLVETYPDAGIEEILRIGRAAQKKTAAILVLASARDKKFAAFCSAKSTDIRPLLKDAMEAHNGRGGGGPGFFQGLFDSAEALAAFLNTVK